MLGEVWRFARALAVQLSLISSTNVGGFAQDVVYRHHSDSSQSRNRDRQQISFVTLTRSHDRRCRLRRALVYIDIEFRSMSCLIAMNLKRQVMSLMH